MTTEPEPREYRISIRTDAPINLGELDEFHALAGRVACALGCNRDDVYLVQRGGDLCAEIATVYTSDGKIHPTTPAAV